MAVGGLKGLGFRVRGLQQVAGKFPPCLPPHLMVINMTVLQVP